VLQALGQELPQLSPVLHSSTVSVAGVFSMKVMSSLKGSAEPNPASVSAVCGDSSFCLMVGVLI
jgi:hypothetical protein